MPGMPEPFTHARQRQNAASLRHVRPTGTVVLAAGATGLDPAPFYKRRYGRAPGGGGA